MTKRFNALGGQKSSDVKFMTEIISQICDYAVDNGLNPTDTVNVIANNLVMIGEISKFDNWERRKKDGQSEKRGYWKDIMMSEATGWDLSLTGGRDEVLETVCSVCGECCAFGGDGESYLSSYCPNCGARMDGENNG